ncbi:hypothetical protein [Natronorubrum texcoconense]|uniref:Uncharacterized protein n=1 Tax=Natronorubrum texcoconense TaxID=1095776 RepID=A0A1G9HAB4_9EURY|nr:hypothetical protein [Natronorubrum texcoconense]SDL09403.1 hypothetical protein SAMN04515672_0152 [Natronorubrum texcoconense]
MEDSKRKTLIKKWNDEISDLRSQQAEDESNQDPMLKAEWRSVRQLASYDLQIGVLEECVGKLEDCESEDDVLEAWGEWRDEVEERDKRILDSTEWFKNNYKKLQLEECVESLSEYFSEDLLTECWRCGGWEKPTSDKRTTEGYRLECPNC